MLNRHRHRQSVSQQGANDTHSAIDPLIEGNHEMAVQVYQINKSFGREEILKRLSVDFRKQEIHGIIGRNGSGKTVMLKCICGFLPIEGGVIRVLGQKVGHDSDFPKKTGVLIESPGFLPNESGRNNLKWLAQLSGNISMNRVDELISLVGLDPASKKHVGKYSLGMRQRLGIAQALLNDPELMILDEPMNGLDKQGVTEMRQVLLSLREQGKSIVLASHFAQDIDELCDTVHEMDQGTLTRLR